MPYQYILANLLAEVEEAAGVLFVDEEGEVVDVAATGATRFDLQITGAYLGIYARRVVSLAAARNLGRPELFYIERPGMSVLGCALSGGYSLGVVQEAPRALGRSRRSLLRAAADLEREVLSEIE